MLNKVWLTGLSMQIENDYGTDKKNEIIGNYENIDDNECDIRVWFDGFSQRLDSLDMKEYLKKLLEQNCPCRCIDIEHNIRVNYEKYNSLQDFANGLRKDGLFDDHIDIKNGAIIATKRFAYECGIVHGYSGTHYTKCHCTLGSMASKTIPDVFCSCCIGFYKKMFKETLGIEVKVELISSVITGGDVCSVTIYFPDIFDKT